MLKIGDQVAKPYIFTRETIRQFAEISGDGNPLHADEDKASLSRFGTIIASGTQTAAVLLGVVASWTASKEPGVGLDFHFRFKKAIPAGTATMLIWKVTNIERREKLNGDLLTLEGSVTDEAGAVYATCQGHSIIWPRNGV